MKKLSKRMVLMLLALSLTGGVTLSTNLVLAEESAKVTTPTTANTLTGQIMGISSKAKTISIKVGDTTEMVKFTDGTKGVEFAEKGESAIITFEIKDNEKVAAEVKPKLAKLPEGVTEVQPEEVAALIAKQDPNYFLADSRPAKRFAEASIPTAVSVPVDTLKEKGESLLPPNKDIPLIFFCGGPTCGMSTESASFAAKWGYKNISVMIKGLPGWKKAGNLSAASNDFVKKGNNIIIDLRNADEVAKGFIPRAVNIPFERFEAATDTFPKTKSAPFVLYGNGDEPKKAIKMLAEKGYKTASIVQGGIEGWRQSGGELTTGEPAKDITYKREPEKGEVSVEEFRKVLESGSANVIILDVRTKDEVAGGKFPQSVAIALDELEKRMAELPKDKDILVHCTTGDRASMAADQLRKAGFKVRHLMAGVECPEGNCAITE